MFIQTEETANPDRLRFLPKHRLVVEGRLIFADAEAATRSALAERLLRIAHVTGVEIAPEAITVSKAAAGAWHLMKAPILGAIIEHLAGGGPILRPEAEREEPAELRKIRDLLDARIRPGMAEEGGDVVLRGFADGTAELEITGGPFALPLFAIKVRIENTFQAFMPAIAVTYVDGRREAPAAGPGLETTEGRAIQALLDQRINPAIAAHGGYISLIDVDHGTAFVRLEGGCQGCGMADVTLKQGVESAILGEVPTIGRVIDVTDHASGENPYYEPNQK